MVLGVKGLLLAVLAARSAQVRSAHVVKAFFRNQQCAERKRRAGGQCAEFTSSVVIGGRPLCACPFPSPFLALAAISATFREL